MECTQDSCPAPPYKAIEDKEAESLTQEAQSFEKEETLEEKGKVMLQKLGITELYTYARKENKEDSYAEPEFEKTLVDFVPSKKYLAIYFTASWCPPCQTFAPVLQQFIEDHEDKIEMIVAPNDTVENKLKNYISPKEWTFIDINNPETVSNLQKRFAIALLPSLVIVSIEERRLVTTWGREAIQYNTANCMADWENNEEGFLWWHFLKFW